METKNINEEQFRKGAEQFVRFWLMPQKYANQTAEMRIKINTKWRGWTLREELIEALGLEIGNTICTDVTPIYMPDVIDEEDDIKLFVSGELIEKLLENNVSAGYVIDCKVCFLYTKVPVGPNCKDVYTVSLRLDEFIRVCEKESQDDGNEDNTNADDVDGFLQNILNNIK